MEFIREIQIWTPNTFFYNIILNIKTFVQVLIYLNE